MRVLVMLLVLGLASISYAGNGLVKVKSGLSVEATISSIETKLKSKGMTIFSRIKHHKGAKKAGLELRETELLIFGNPKVGTKLMDCNQTAAIDLPLKFISWEDKKGQVWVGYNNPSYMGKRHKIKKCAKKQLTKMSMVLNKLASSVTEKPEAK